VEKEEIFQKRATAEGFFGSMGYFCAKGKNVVTY
jgi:hypothetical protein